MAKKRVNRRFFLVDRETGERKRITFNDIIKHYNDTEPPFVYTKNNIDLSRFEQEMLEIGYDLIYECHKKPLNMSDIAVRIEKATWPMSEEEYKRVIPEIRDKIKKLFYNIHVIEDFDVAKGSYNRYNISSIICDLDNQYDEFFVERINDYRSSLYVEVVTEDVARSNDLERIRGSREDRDKENDYILGESLSDYKKLGDSDYYYRLM